MGTALALALLTLRVGLRLRRARQLGGRRPPDLRMRHLRFAKPAVALALVGFVGGPLSMLLLRGQDPFGTVHAWLGAGAAGLFAAAGLLGHRIEIGRSRRLDAHALLGALALLLGAVAAVAGFVILP